MKAEPYQLVRLKNGACNIRALAEDETFHPVVGPVAEAEALYVRQLRFRQRLQSHQGEFVVWDVGLGAAANAVAVLRAASDLPCALRVISFDRTLDPLEFALRHAADLGYFAGYEKAARELLDTGRALGGRWELRLGDFPNLLRHPPPPAPRRTPFYLTPFRPQKIPPCGPPRSSRICAAAWIEAPVRDADVFAQHHVAGDAAAGGLFCRRGAVLQFQAFMFSKGFSQMLGGTAAGNPAVIADPINWSAKIIAGHGTVTNAIFAFIQLVIALGIAWRPTLKLALGASIVWALGVWWFGEGLGGVLNGPAARPTARRAP